MPQIPFYILNAFTDKPYAGNPAGVFFDDEAVLSASQMRRMAGEIGLESAFVTPAELGSDADFRLRYFTGVTEVPFCGHDTVAVTAALVYAARANVSNSKLKLKYQTPVGIISVDFHEEGGWVTLHQNRPEFSVPADSDIYQSVADALGISPEQIKQPVPIQRVSTGTPWLIVPVWGNASVDSAPASFDAISQISRDINTFGIYLFSCDDTDDEVSGTYDWHVWSRCFAPIAGLNEDPVTGSASGALGGYLAHHDLLEVAPGETARIIARQGFGGGRGGRAEIVVGRDLSGGIDRIAVVGQAILIAEGSIVAPAGT